MRESAAQAAYFCLILTESKRVVTEPVPYLTAILFF